MKKSLHVWIACLGMIFAVSLLGRYVWAQDKAGPETQAGGESSGWPRIYATGTENLTVYQPQMDLWDGFNLKAHAAVAVSVAGFESPVFGVIHFTAHTLVDKPSRVATLEEIKITQVQFPSASDREAFYGDFIRKNFASHPATMALDRLEANLATLDEGKKFTPVPVKNDVPRFIFTTRPSLLIYVDGVPTYQPIENTGLERVINTQALLLRDHAGHYYLHVFDGWMTALTLDGSWVAVKGPTPELAKALSQAGPDVDLIPGGNPEEKSSLPSLAGGAVPDVFISTSPAELVVTDGAPNFTPIEGTKLLYVSNTTGNVFKYLGDQKNYVLASGRWFSARSLDGPWQFVSADRLPSEFAKIPDQNEKENVKAEVPGTQQAQDALIDNSVPQTAKVERKTATFTPARCDGVPEFRPIAGTTLQSAANCALPLIRVRPQSYYALEDGVWFLASSLNGPWVVADSVPSAIYRIPPEDPLYYVTYVHVYDATPEYVYVGYTPGYFGAYVGPGIVVYGTGYRYHPWVHRIWIGPPVTYGLGIGVRYTPWAGWTWGVGFGWWWSTPTVAISWGWGCLPWWGPFYYRPVFVSRLGFIERPESHRWVGFNGDVYRRWENRGMPARPSLSTPSGWRGRTAMAYNSHTGGLIAGQHAPISRAFVPAERQAFDHGPIISKGGSVSVVHGAPHPEIEAGHGGTLQRSSGAGTQGEWHRRNVVYGTHEGQIYRPAQNGNKAWEQHVKAQEWKPVRDNSRIRSLENEQTAREVGEQRAARVHAPEENEKPRESVTRPEHSSMGKAGHQGDRERCR